MDEVEEEHRITPQLGAQETRWRVEAKDKKGLGREKNQKFCFGHGRSVICLPEIYLEVSGKLLNI